MPSPSPTISSCQLPSAKLEPALAEGRTGKPCLGRLRAAGNFLWCGDEKIYIKGVSYGAFAPNARGEPFPEPEVTARDFRMMAAAGLNCIRTYEVPSQRLLDQAAEHGLRVLAGVPWAQHLTLADNRTGLAHIEKAIREGVRACARHPALLACCVGNEIPTQIMRWYGKHKAEWLIRVLFDAAKDIDPDLLVTYANYPSTEYLELPFLDFHCFNVYLHDERTFQTYLARLQMLAGNKPVCLSEYGMDALAHGEAAQADFLEWQTQAIFRAGFCGAVAFAWTDDWYRGGEQVRGWQFGITDAARNPKSAYKRLGQVWPVVPFKRDGWPRLGVVVAAYNAAATLDDCLASLSASQYPGLEVVVVNDGSSDRTGEIVDAHARLDSRIRSLHTGNHGLSVARNLGLTEVAGDIVAYTDADCRIDPDWPYYLALKLMNSDVVAVGGPNLVPPDDGPVAQAVGFSPGNPTQIMLSEEIAEHVPGCNMAFWKWVLEDIGGFQPVYRAAGDDVDICWRLQARGYRIGYASSAVVWHHRRNSLGAYLKQQVGYGHAESLLEREHPEKFNGLGQVRWAGRIYTGLPALRLWQKPRIYQGVFGSAAFQSLYSPAEGLFAYLPQTPEWYALLLMLLGLSIFNPALSLLPIMGFGWQAAVCLYAAQRTPLPRRHAAALRGLIFVMHLLQPLARSWGRFQGGLGPFRWTRSDRQGLAHANLPVQHERFRLRDFEVACWGEDNQDKDAFLNAAMNQLFNLRCVVEANSGWEAWDLQIERGLSGRAYLLAATEYHGGPNVLIRSKVHFGITPAAVAVMAALSLMGVYFYAYEWQPSALDVQLNWLALSIPLLGLLWLAWQRALLAAHIDESLRQAASLLRLKVMDPGKERR